MKSEGTKSGRARPSSRPPPHPREELESAFTPILATLTVRLRGACAAALVDPDGETVDYAGRLDPFAIRLAAAYWKIVLDEARTQSSLRGLRFVTAQTLRASFLAHELPEGHALVVELARDAALAGWQRAVAACIWALSEEAGWRLHHGRPTWTVIDVVSDGARRPLGVRRDGRVHALDILGSVVQGAPRGRPERSWRVRFASGIEATLVREVGGTWYADEPPGDAAR